MNKKTLSIACVASLLCLGIQSASAENVAVEGNSIFILDNSVAGSQIIVKNLSDGIMNTCLADAGFNQLNLEPGITATDIIIKTNTAVVTTNNSNTTPNTTDVKLVNVTSCLSTTTVTPGTVDLSQCYATLVGSHLHVPCFILGDEIISVELEQRGNSMNFEYLSYKPKED